MTETKSAKVNKLRALQDLFIEQLPLRLEAIQQAWQANSKISSDHAEFHRLVHSLAGSAGSFGFSQLGRNAHDLEMLIKQLDNPAKENEFRPDIARIEQALDSLRAMAARGPESLLDESLELTDVGGNGKPALIYILEDDTEKAEEMTQELQNFGYDVEKYHKLQDINAAVVRQLPGALVINAQLSDDANAGVEVVANLRRCTMQDLPVIFVSAHNTWQNRLEAVRAGGQAYLLKPVNYGVLLDSLDSLIGEREKVISYRVLIVDDSVLLSGHYANVLQNAGMEVEVINNPAQLLDTLSFFRPELILLDIFMPGCSGLEAVQVIRQHQAYINIPIVYLSTEAAIDQRLEGLRLGGDDFLQKPINDSHLVTAVRLRARRFRELTTLMISDSLTGLLNHANFKLTLEREIFLAERRSSPLSLVMLDIDHFKAVNDTYGHINGDRVIRNLASVILRKLRKTDIAARYGGEEFAIVLSGTEVSDAYTVIDKVRKEFEQSSYMHEKGEFNATFSAGIAACPPYIEIDELIAEADSALYLAKNRGRNQVVISKKSDTGSK